MAISIDCLAQGVIAPPKSKKETKTQNSGKNDISNYINIFKSSSGQEGMASWRCLISTPAVQVSDNLEYVNSVLGSYILYFTAPLTYNGHPLAQDQLGKTIIWDIALFGPNAGVCGIGFYANIQYVSLPDIADKIANSAGARYLYTESIYLNMDYLKIYSLGDFRMIIEISEGAHGGDMTITVFDKKFLSDFINAIKE